MNTAYEQLINCSEDVVSNAMFKCINVLQNYRGGEQIAVCAILSILMAERHDVSSKEAYHVGEKIIAVSDFYTKGEQFRGARAYLKNEV